MSESKNIYQRLHAVMKAVEYVQKQKKDEMKYSVVSHDTVVEKVRPHLLENGVMLFPHKVARSQEGTRTQIDMVLRFVNVDDPKDFLDVETCGYGVDSQDKGPGKAMTYSVKAAVLKTLFLQSGDDPDDVHAEKVAEKRATKEQRATQTMLVNKINRAMDQMEIESVIDEHRKEYDDLPDMFREFVDTAYEMREQQIKNGTAEIVGESFNGVQDSRKRAGELRAEMEKCATVAELDAWEKQWMPTINNFKGQSKGGKDSDVFKSYLVAKRADLVKNDTTRLMEAG